MMNIDMNTVASSKKIESGFERMMMLCRLSFLLSRICCQFTASCICIGSGIRLYISIGLRMLLFGFINLLSSSSLQNTRRQVKLLHSFSSFILECSRWRTEFLSQPFHTREIHLRSFILYFQHS